MFGRVAPIREVSSTDATPHIAPLIVKNQKRWPSTAMPL
jgi:hypothetical protein